MTENLKNKLIKLNDDQLLDIIKNLKKYNYDIKTREMSLKILQDRGFSNNVINNIIENSETEKNYDKNLLTEYLNKYKKLSIITILSSLILFFIYPIFSNIIFILHQIFKIEFSEMTFNITLFILIIVIFPLYIVSYIKTYLQYVNFYDIIYKNKNKPKFLNITFILGLSFFIGFYFYFLYEMKKDLKENK